MDGTAVPGRQRHRLAVSGASRPRPADEMRGYTGRGLLDGLRALVTGADQGIGRAVAIAFAKEGADVAISYPSHREHADARHTARLIERENRSCVMLRADLGREVTCEEVVSKAAQRLGGLDVLVNCAATQTPTEDLAELSTEQWEHTFRVNVHSCFWLIRAALAHLTPGGRVINSGAMLEARADPRLIDYCASKGAVLALTHALAPALEDRGIRVNCVAPGPLPSSQSPASCGLGGTDGRLGEGPYARPVEPDEVAPSYVFFASDTLSGRYTGGALTAPDRGLLPG